jgi:hypothetical protein
MDVRQLGRVVRHHAGIDAAPFIAIGSQACPCEDLLFFQRQPSLRLAAGFANRLCVARSRDQASVAGLIAQRLQYVPSLSNWALFTGLGFSGFPVFLLF